MSKDQKKTAQDPEIAQPINTDQEASRLKRQALIGLGIAATVTAATAAAYLASRPVVDTANPDAEENAQAVANTFGNAVSGFIAPAAEMVIGFFNTVGILGVGAAAMNRQNQVEEMPQPKTTGKRSRVVDGNKANNKQASLSADCGNGVICQAITRTPGGGIGQEVFVDIIKNGTVVGSQNVNVLHRGNQRANDIKSFTINNQIFIVVSYTSGTGDQAFGGTGDSANLRIFDVNNNSTLPSLTPMNVLFPGGVNASEVVVNAQLTNPADVDGNQGNILTTPINVDGQNIFDGLEIKYSSDNVINPPPVILVPVINNNQVIGFQQGALQSKSASQTPSTSKTSSNSASSTGTSSFSRTSSITSSSTKTSSITPSSSRTSSITISPASASITASSTSSTSQVSSSPSPTAFDNQSFLINGVKFDNISPDKPNEISGNVYAHLVGTANAIIVNGITAGVQYIVGVGKIRDDLFVAAFMSGDQLLISTIKLIDNKFEAVRRDIFVGFCSARCKPEITADGNNLFVAFGADFLTVFNIQGDDLVSPSPSATTTKTPSPSSTATFTPSKSFSSSLTPSPSQTPSPSAFPGNITLTTDDGSDITYRIYYSNGLTTEKSNNGTVEQVVNVPNNPTARNSTLEDATLVGKDRPIGKDRALAITYNQANNTYLAVLNSTNLNTFKCNFSGGMFDNPNVAGLFGDNVARVDVNDVSKDGRLLFSATALNNDRTSTNVTFEIDKDGLVTVAEPGKKPYDKSEFFDKIANVAGVMVGASAFLACLACCCCCCKVDPKKTQSGSTVNPTPATTDATTATAPTTAPKVPIYKKLLQQFGLAK